MSTAEMKIVSFEELDGGRNERVARRLDKILARFAGDRAIERIDAVLAQYNVTRSTLLSYANYGGLIETLGETISDVWYREVFTAQAKTILAHAHIERLIEERDSVLDLVEVVNEGLGLCNTLMSSTSSMSDLDNERAADLLAQHTATLEEQLAADDPLRKNFTELAVHVLSTERRRRAQRALAHSLLPDERVFSDDLLSIATYHPVVDQGDDDWWTVKRLPDGRTVVVLCGGSEIDGQLHYAMVRGIVDVAARLPAEELTCSNIVGMINESLYSCTRGQASMTCLVSIFDPETKTVMLANAGFTTPFLLRDCDGKLGVYDKFGKGAPIGSSARPTIAEKSVRLQHGDVMVWYSDGVLECLDQSGERFGRRRLKNALSGLDLSQSSVELRDSIADTVERHRAGQPRHTDQTILVARISPYC